MKTTIDFDSESEKVISSYRKSRDPIPTMVDAVNELIHRAGKK